LRTDQIAQFHRDGFLVLPRILSEEQVRRARAAVDRLFRGECTHDRRPPEHRRPLPSRPRDGTTNHTVNGRLLDGDLWEISTDARLGEMAARLLGTASVSLMEDQLIEKGPGGPPVAMHQDAPYLTFLRNWDVINLWIALTDITAESAPLLCIRGSHRWPVAAKPRHFTDGDDAGLMEVVAGARPEGEPVEAVPVLVPAGGGAFFGALTMHGSPRNRSFGTRYAYTLHYAAAECRADTSRWPSNYEPYVVAGITDESRIASAWMPVVYPAA
jgi:phytanoyl-CoA hydroxylase